MNVSEQIKQKAQTVKELDRLHEKNFWDNFQGRKDWKKKWEEECKNNKWIRLDDVLGLLDGCVLVKEEKLKELRGAIKETIDVYDVIAFFDKHEIFYDEWLKSKVFQLLEEIRDKVDAKFVELTEKEREK